MGWKLEAVSIPASDVDRAKTFYAEKVGFNVDLDVNADGDPSVGGRGREPRLRRHRNHVRTDQEHPRPGLRHSGGSRRYRHEGRRRVLAGKAPRCRAGLRAGLTPRGTGHRGSARSFWNGGRKGPRPRGVLYASLGYPDDNGWTLPY